MPMGAVTAFYGIKKCISILHGSQGCSTYIRRHMATHYNEPVDIASSALTEEGTVFGGEKNLMKGLKNLITLYHPEVIGIATTCLAETIGEDVPRIVMKFREEYPEYNNIMIIPVNSPGYGGTQFEGYYKALRSIVEQVLTGVEKQTYSEREKPQWVNVICSPLSPRDMRYLKNSFAEFGIEAIFLPDLSDSLDGGYRENYDRLSMEGTSLEDIRKMAEAKITIEITNLDLEYAPGKYLNEVFGIPVKRINIPTGLRDTDAFYEMLSQISGRSIPLTVSKERSRYIDAMIDSHKYNGTGRAVIYGEPDFVCSMVRIAVENGIMPMVCATGSVNKNMKQQLEEEIKKVAERYYIDHYEIMDDVDFKVIESMAEKLGANIMIGNSDGRRMEDQLKIPLVRRGFPIHDRMGGQRLRMLGYEGSLLLLDDITNGLLGRKEKSFREDAYQNYFLQPETKVKEIIVEPFSTIKKDIEEKTKNHPCFNGCASGSARMHLPIAPKCNVQCNYCVRKFDCPNESRPGVTTKVLTPEEAFEKYKAVKKKMKNLSVVGIAGPGDALANFEETKRTLELIREYDKDVTFCLSTNGLMLPEYADELCSLGVTHVTVTMNAVDVKIGAQIYKHVTYNGVKFEGESAAAILMSNQLSGLRLLVQKGVICKVNIVMLKGINDEHIPEIVKKVKEIGCYVTNIMPFIQVKGSAFEHLPTTSIIEINKLRDLCGQTMKQMYHCRQCRADAIGTLEEDRSSEFNQFSNSAEPEDNKKVLRFAIASKSGILVDQHFGHATEFYIYEYAEGKAIYKEKRIVEKYCEGVEVCEEKEDKIDLIIRAIHDCNGVIAARIGDSPKQRLIDKNIKVFVTYDRIEDAIKKSSHEFINDEKTMSKIVSCLP